MTVSPTQPLEPNTEYEVLLDGIEDAVGNKMERYAFRFSTGGTIAQNSPPTIQSFLFLKEQKAM